MKPFLISVLTGTALLLAADTAFSLRSGGTLVPRVDIATVQSKGGKLYIRAVASVPTNSWIRGSGELKKRGERPNKDGLMEYEFHYKAPPNYKGDKLSLVRATLTDSSVPPGVKGVLIYSENNEFQALLSEGTKRKAKGEPVVAGEEELKKKAAAEAEAPVKRQAAVVQEETAPKPEKKSWWKFGRKTSAQADVTPTPTPEAKKKRVAAAPVTEEKPKKRVPSATPTPTPEEVVVKKKSWLRNPFRRAAAEPVEAPAPTPEVKKRRAAAASVAEATPKRPGVSATPPPLPASEAETKTRTGWNPFRRKSVEPQDEAAPPISEQRRSGGVAEEKPRRTAASTMPSPSPTPKAKAKRKEEAPAEEQAAEQKKPSKMRYLNPVNWNPFKRKAEPTPSPSPEG